MTSRMSIRLRWGVLDMCVGFLEQISGLGDQRRASCITQAGMKALSFICYSSLGLSSNHKPFLTVNSVAPGSPASQAVSKVITF